MKTDMRLSQFLRECIYIICHDGRLPVNNIIRLNVRRPGVFSRAGTTKLRLGTRDSKVSDIAL